jgi:UDP-N-acetylglucosamine 2-epimerase (non-hydrolysing)
MHIIHIVGARPNFMKVAPVIRAISDKAAIVQTLVHTGQHYDSNMSDIFFSQLGISEPDINLEVGSGSHAFQTAQVMVKLEGLFGELKPDWVFVYGDVNSTLAASLVCAKQHIKLAHVEAGLRSFDRTMPEEINRIVTDSLADLLFTPSSDGDENLIREGVDPVKIYLVGNVMIDTLIRLRPEAEQLWDRESRKYRISKKSFTLVTLHRPSNVDNPEMLKKIIYALNNVSLKTPVLFPIHPRTRNSLQNMPDVIISNSVMLSDPIGYIEFLCLQSKARLVITDSGGIQEETTYLGTPCLTVRENTERPVTVDAGTNILVGQDMDMLESHAYSIINGNVKEGNVPLFWDGMAGYRIAQIIDNIFLKKIDK